MANSALIVISFAAVAFVVGCYFGRVFWAWLVASFLAVLASVLSTGPLGFVLSTALFWLICAVVLGVPVLRCRLVSRAIMPKLGRMLPLLGETERIALEAGTVWWDGELFSGNPCWQKLLAFEARPLSTIEQAFLAGPTEELCQMIDDWAVVQAHDLPDHVWDFIKKRKFLGLVIPETYEGLGFSAYGHAQVIAKLSSRSIAAAVTVMVPNSLGPATLLLRYGTDQQKSHYLPRLARGEEIPCFALTGPEAGSDAAATQSSGVVCLGRFAGQEVLGMRLNWVKRYITLSPIATLIGLAFRLRDPERLLGGTAEPGITCALIPAHLPGIVIGRRHDPMGVPFQNGPTAGYDVFVPLDFIIGGRKMAGQGWRMLMESLGAGRGISLPSLAVGAAELATRIVGAYATVREQFDTPIGRFEGIEEPLARIAGLTYLMTAARRLTLAAIDAGQEPSVLTAIVKTYLTEAMRQVVNDAMDIRAGSGIMEGPQNILGRIYKALPIGITVEGANILTRSMIIYGQGAIRCHPFVYREMQAVMQNNLVQFDQAFFGHLNFVSTHLVRAPLLALGGWRWLRFRSGGKLDAYFHRVTRLSSAFVLISDLAMLTLGGALKRHEKITGRLADALAWLYLASATLKKFHDDRQQDQQTNEPVARWALEHSLFQIQTALAGVIANLPNRPVAWLLSLLVFPLGKRYAPPSDRLGAEVARAVVEGHAGRLALSRDIFVPSATEAGLGRLEASLEPMVEALAVEAKVRDAVRAGRLDKAPGLALIVSAADAGIITSAEADTALAAKELQEQVIQVDSFDGQANPAAPARQSVD